MDFTKIIVKWLHKFEGHWDIYTFGCIAGCIAMLVALWQAGMLNI